ncbi:interferon- double-stranded RNA-activated kinase-like protein [Labeo rohita]|uniref:Interferon-double-stranded RNA-activated kinase-like protein n=1 Tax=Labeo rohita TaxID=84645 RepID=A0A498LLU1_LABRO|nr:interferon- double-stranded RNA-activated kinase-like protein [Labeo rohita]
MSVCSDTLNEYQQKTQCTVEYEEGSTDGPSHNKTFTMRAIVNGQRYPDGTGKTKKEAKQNAAKNVLNGLKSTKNIEVTNYVSWLNEYSQKNKLPFKARESTVMDPGSTTQLCTYVCKYVSGDKVYPEAYGKNKKDAKEAAATRVYEEITKTQNAEVGTNMNVQNPAKPPGGQTSNQPTKSRFLEDFDSVNPIGKGGFGRVFKARRILENTYYAVKIVKSTKKARREVGALAKFNNVNIVRYYSCWVEDTAYRHDSSESYSFSDSGSDPTTKFLYIQMEFCEGDTLWAWIDKRNSSDAQYPERRTDAAQINRQVLKAVEYIHSKGLIHRDLKPLNIMFSGEGKVKVGDFGLVTAAENDNDEQLLERTKRTGTRIYMSPEQIWDEIRSRHFPPQFSKKFKFEHKLIEQMLSPRPEERPDASELIRELDRYTNILNADKDNRTI